MVREKRYVVAPKVEGIGEPLTFEKFLDRSKMVTSHELEISMDEMGRIVLPQYRPEGDDINMGGLRRSIEYILRKAGDADIKNVVVEGFSAKPAGMLFQWGWDNMYPDRKKPKMYSLGDSLIDDPGVKHIETPDELNGNRRLTLLMREGGLDAAVKRFEDRFPNLVRDKDLPTMVISEYVDRGRSFKAVEDVLKKTGFSKLHFAALVLNEDQYYWGKRVSDQVNAEKPVNPLESPLWVGAEVSGINHVDHPYVFWLHLRSELYNELKKPESERDQKRVDEHRARIAKTLEVLKGIAKRVS